MPPQMSKHFFYHATHTSPPLRSDRLHSGCSPPPLVLSKSKSLYDWWSVNMCWSRAHSGTCDLILLPVGRFLSESCGLVTVGRPLWREEGYAVCSATTQWSESSRTSNHTLPSYLRLLKPGGPGSRIVAVITPGTGVPLRLARLRWWYSNPPLQVKSSQVKTSYSTTDGQPANLSWCQAPISDSQPIFLLLSLIIFRELRI
jgi:hypothetical protein